MPTTPIVYGSPFSTFVRSVLLAFEEKAAPYDNPAFRSADLRSETHLARNPFGRMPVLDDDGFVLYETQAIIRYIDQTRSGPVLTPAAPKAAARMNQLMGILNCYLFPAGAGIVGERLVAPMLGRATDEARVAASVAPTRTAATAVERLLNDTEFLTGDTLSLADLLIAPVVAALLATAEGTDVLRETPKLTTWYRRIAERPSMLKTAPRLG